MAAPEGPVVAVDDTSGAGPSTGSSSEHGLVERFDPVTRAVHWINATLVLTLVATGSIMYIGSLQELVGRRVLVRTIHVYCGLGLVVPFAAGLVGPWGTALRRDFKRLGRFLADDWRWFDRKRRRSGGLRIGKFNAGQKVNAILVAGALPVMLATGAIMRWHDPFPDSVRTGATFVHDWGYLALAALIAGHIFKALADPESLRGMVTGQVTRRWARREHPRWADELEPPR